ncbi:hypothetical protein [Streptomyces bauhiniae]|uniref:Uncharacterized protein n=1 Tax=Streptomyces bauhiniae TaxID=2340725 RepID=A0A7K3QK66_9ACTN|nr:hypothetical protein [Streptomyces bauhiniae]NEB90160.1 hypothetical protein [Streptomyces bauhiniae]
MASRQMPVRRLALVAMVISQLTMRTSTSPILERAGLAQSEDRVDDRTGAASDQCHWSLAGIPRRRAVY